jgi:DnaJ-domain-containing protein 1
MSLLQRLARIARAEAAFLASKAREIGRRKHDGADAEPATEPQPEPRRAERPGARRQSSAPGDDRDPKIASHYAALQLPYGADVGQVKRAYRALMRKYHPDLHGSDPRRQQQANEVTQHLSEAYQALRKHLGD